MLADRAILAYLCSQVSPEVAAEAEGCDLVILEGMGRGIETNLYAAFTCDSAKLGMIKVSEFGWAIQPNQAHKGAQSVWEA